MADAISDQQIQFRTAVSPKEFEAARLLFQEYAASLNVDLCFQDFDSELLTIDKQYSKPKGALLLAWLSDVAVGCVAVRELEGETAEMKRMYVKPGYRGMRIGQGLLEKIISIARDLNYTIIRLDTLPDMAKAQELYRSYGFREIPSYRHNPVGGTLYMEKTLVGT